MKEIKLTREMVAIVDDDDFVLLSNYKWYAHKRRNHFYAARSIKVEGKWHTLSMHHAVLPCPKGHEVDHINGRTLDNRKENLRIATKGQNQYNQHSIQGLSKYKGVDFNKGKWRARLQYNKKPIYIGYYACEEDAAKAYDQKARELFGEFAAPNFN